jgi:hypothetical protein
VLWVPACAGTTLIDAVVVLQLRLLQLRLRGDDGFAVSGYFFACAASAVLRMVSRVAFGVIKLPS